jgi:hypothetical protein
MDSKTIISNFRNALKNKTLDAHAFNELCQVLKSPSVTQDELVKIFSKTTISNIVCLENAEIFCLMSSFFWETSIDLWDLFFEIAKDTKKIKTHQFYNELIKYGDARVMLIVENFLNTNSVKISGKFYSYGSPNLDSEITPEFAKKIANYTGKVLLDVITISPESARILAHKKGQIDTTLLFTKHHYRGKTPKWEDYDDFFKNVVAQGRNSSISFHAAGINHHLAAILGNARCLLQLYGIKHLTVGVARGLAKHRGYGFQEDLMIGNGDTLDCDPGALQEFKNHEGKLCLDGVISEITFDDAKALACHEGDLNINLINMPEPKALEELLKIKHWLQLTITVHPTKSYQPPLTPDLAEMIGNYQGKGLSFSYFGEVPVESAEKLAKLRKRLWISGNLNDEAEDKLKEAGVGIAHIYSAERLKAKVLDLAKVERFLEDKDSVNLSEMTSITEDAVLKALTNYQGDLDLSGLTELSDSAVKDLSKHHGGHLRLNGLTELSNSAVKDLSKHQGELGINGLTALSDAVAESLSNHQGALWLSGLTELSDAAAKALSKHQHALILDGLANLSDVAAEALSKHQGVLSFDGLTELSDAAVESLAKHPGNLYLGGLTKLSESAANALSKIDGNLSLSGLTKLSDAAAEALSKHQGSLFLHNVSALSDAAASALIKHQGKIDSREPADWVDWKMKHWA